MGTSTGASPLRKVSGARRSEKTVNDYIQTLKEYLYEEGPQTADHLSDVLGVGESWTLDVLNMGRLEGTFTTIRWSDNQVYWMLDESH